MFTEPDENKLTIKHEKTKLRTLSPHFRTSPHTTDLHCTCLSSLKSGGLLLAVHQLKKIVLKSRFQQYCFPVFLLVQLWCGLPEFSESYQNVLIIVYIIIGVNGALCI